MSPVASTNIIWTDIKRQVECYFKFSDICGPPDKNSQGYLDLRLFRSNSKRQRRFGETYKEQNSSFPSWNIAPIQCFSFMLDVFIFPLYAGQGILLTGRCTANVWRGVIGSTSLQSIQSCCLPSSWFYLCSPKSCDVNVNTYPRSCIMWMATQLTLLQQVDKAYKTVPHSK